MARSKIKAPLFFLADRKTTMKAMMRRIKTIKMGSTEALNTS
jgi:hypothetical protein